MKMHSLFVGAAVAAFVLALQFAYPGDEKGKDGGPSGAFSYSKDAEVAAVQKKVKAVVKRYQDGLNSSDFAKIRPLFAKEAVAEWNEKATVIGIDAMVKPYENLFKEIKFNTDFQYDALDVYGDVAIVRTHHPVGQTELILNDRSKKLDFNREIFVLRRIGDEWMIILYRTVTELLLKQGKPVRAMVRNEDRRAQALRDLRRWWSATCSTSIRCTARSPAARRCTSACRFRTPTWPQRSMRRRWRSITA